jgi:hypothetical protein
MTNPKRNWLKGAFQPAMKRLPDLKTPTTDAQPVAGANMSLIRFVKFTAA